MTEVIVDNFALLESKSQTEQRNDKGMENNNPFSDQPNQNVDPFSEESTDSIDISDDDLPF